jgi:hypothetical protein
MATIKLTITLDAEQVKCVRELVAAGQASSVSGFVQHAVGQALNDVAGWKQLLGNALMESGGPLTKEERRWADSVLTPTKPKKRAKSHHAA